MVSVLASRQSWCGTVSGPCTGLHSTCSSLTQSSSHNHKGKTELRKCFFHMCTITMIFLAAFHQETFLYVVYDRGLRASLQNVLTFMRLPGTWLGS